MKVLSFLLVAGHVACGCGRPPESDRGAMPVRSPATSVAPEHTEVVEAETLPTAIGVDPDSPSPESLWTRAEQRFAEAKQAGTTSARSVADWVSQAYANSIANTQQAANSANDWISRTYQEALVSGETTAKTAADWIKDDLAKSGTWQYKVVTLKNQVPEELENELNQLGEHRWECFLIVSMSDAQVPVLYCKRPHRSYLRQLPAKDLLRLLPNLGLGDPAD